MTCMFLNLARFYILLDREVSQYVKKGFDVEWRYVFRPIIFSCAILSHNVEDGLFYVRQRHEGAYILTTFKERSVGGRPLEVT